MKRYSLTQNELRLEIALRQRGKAGEFDIPYPILLLMYASGTGTVENCTDRPEDRDQGWIG